jgi:hypothetical protein
MGVEVPRINVSSALHSSDRFDVADPSLTELVPEQASQREA